VLRQMADRMPPDQAEVFQHMMPYLSGANAVWTAVLSPISALIAIYLTSGILHLLLMLFRGAGRGFDATLTTVGYAHGLYLLLAVPACGSLIALVWYVVVLIIGLGEAQRCGPGKAAAAVLLPFVLGGVTKGGVDL